MRTRKQLKAEIATLKSRLGAAAGETRKGLRAHLMRTAQSRDAFAKSLDECEAALKQAKANYETVRSVYGPFMALEEGKTHYVTRIHDEFTLTPVVAPIPGKEGA